MAAGETARLRLRSARPRDARPIARVHVLSWKAAYPGHVDQDYLDGLNPSEHESGWFARLYDPAIKCEVALYESEVVGFVCWGESRDAEPLGARVGEIQSLYVHPDWWGRGVGRLLFSRARTLLRRLGFTELITWALVDHAQSVAFYRGHGMREDGSERVDHPSEGVALPLFRLRMRIDEAQPWLTGETLRRAALHCGFAGLVAWGTLALFGRFTGAPPLNAALFGLAGGCALLPLHLLRAKRLTSVGGDRRLVPYGALAFWLALASCLIGVLWAMFMVNSLDGGHAAALTELAESVLGSDGDSLENQANKTYLVALLCSPWAMALAFGTNSPRSVVGTLLGAIAFYALLPLTILGDVGAEGALVLLLLMLLGVVLGLVLAGLRVVAELPGSAARVALGSVERRPDRHGAAPLSEAEADS